MEKREYGTTGESLSIVGFGGILVSGGRRGRGEGCGGRGRGPRRRLLRRGAHVRQRPGDARARPWSPTARGCSWPARPPSARAAGARRELEESLRLLRTDHVDLYQLHAVNTDEDFEQVMGPGGALELFREARERGMTRYLGFSSHSSETALRLIEAVDFDSVLFPVNWSTWFAADFGPAVVAAAEARGTALLALKSAGPRQDGRRRRAQVGQVLVRAPGGPRAGGSWPCGSPCRSR